LYLLWQTLVYPLKGHQIRFVPPLAHHKNHHNMALVRDPYFWKRFSTAVHLDDEAKSASTLDLESMQKR